METGRDRLLDQIKHSARNYVILGVILTLMPIFIILIVFIFVRNRGDIFWIIAPAVCMACGIAVFVFQIKTYFHPENAGVFKKNPLILPMVDELIANKVYEDRFLVFSPRIIANAMDLKQISYTDEVFLIYVYIHRTNGVMDLKQLVLANARNTIKLNIMAKKDPEINELINNIVCHCRYARVGYNPEGLAYLENMKKIWAEDQARKNTQS